tara:strand:- start:66052 stop:67620 length:1569 start_codon:yes stop_codon:yes gene_type:complete
MRKIHLTFAALLISIVSFGQEYLIENFDYGFTQDNLINVGFNWVEKAGADDTPRIDYSVTSLMMPDYEPIAIGGSAKLNIASQPGQFGADLHRQLDLLSGTIYLSALVNVTFARTGDSDYFLHFNEETFVSPGVYSDENARARVFVRDDGSGGINFGILSSGTSADVSWDSNSYAKLTTYLIVASYDTASGTSKLYVLTAPVANEPAQANALHQSSGVVEINKISLRQEAYTPIVTIDGLKVVGNWSDLWPPLNLPDANLETAMSNYTLAIDTGGDGLISLEEAAAYTGALDFSNLGIDDISGLQYFTSVSELNISGNNISDLSLLFGNVPNVASKNSQTKNASVNTFTGLQVLNCSNNNLTNLDLSGVSTLTSLDCSNNQLESLNLKNGNNTILTSFNATSNSSLACAQVDDVAWSDANWANKDSQTEFKTDCATVLGLDDVIEKESIAFYPNPVSDFIHLESDETIKKAIIYNLFGQEIGVFNKESIIDNSIDVSNRLQGIYFLKVEINDTFQVIKFVKE